MTAQEKNLKALLKAALDHIENDPDLRGKIIDALEETPAVRVQWISDLDVPFKFYGLAGRLLATVEGSEDASEYRWKITLANGKQDYIFRHGVLSTLEDAKDAAEHAINWI